MLVAVRTQLFLGQVGFNWILPISLITILVTGNYFRGFRLPPYLFKYC